MTLVTEFNPGMDVTDESTAVFGYDSQINTKIINGGTLAMGGIFDDTMQTLFDLASNVDPASTVLRGNYPNVIFADVLRARKDPSKRFYTYVELYPQVSFVCTPPGGGPKEKPTFTFEGKCKAPISFRAQQGKGIAISWDVVKLASGATSCTGDMNDVIPTYIPFVPGFEGSSKYALLVEIQKRDKATNPCRIVKSAYLPVSDAMVTAGATKGKITITQQDLQGTGIETTEDLLYAHVCFVQEVDPYAEGDDAKIFLLGDQVNCRGRFDIETT
jgi:hypothetical protein